MRFSVDAHALGRHLTGNEVYVRNLLLEFSRLDRESAFLAYVSGEGADPAIRDVPGNILKRHVSLNPLVRLGWELTRRLRQDQPDLVHVQYTAPLRCPVPVVVTVHDVSFEDHPEFFAWPRCRQLRATVRHTVARAARIIAPSEFSRHEIIRVYGVAPEQVVTIPNGVAASFRPLPQAQARGYTSGRFGITRPFLLTVGDLHRRKNQLGLIRAFEALLRENPELPHDLVLVGKDTWFSRRIRAAARDSSVSSRIRFTGWVDDGDLLQLYNACDAFVFPSFYEGFGLPVLEAMACGCAVACSGGTALDEVAERCAVTFDPRRTEEMVRALRELLLDSDLRARMGRMGQQRAARFTWNTTARRTLDVYYEVTGRAPAALAEAGRGVRVAR